MSLQPGAGDVVDASFLVVGALVSLANLYLLASTILGPLFTLLVPPLESWHDCGRTTEGQEECYFDCIVFSDVSVSGQVRSPYLLLGLL